VAFLDTAIKEYAQKIAGHDGRPAHPEDYRRMAFQLLKSPAPDKLLAQVVLLSEHPEVHTAWRYSFLDFWDVIIGRPPAAQEAQDGQCETL
jgi:hypothetical protein